ncbi:MAG TPA: hypothetical protein VNG04_10565 [Candidatus Acidoferrum sp.]|nr:hypothetical protein [Candidatus Acidoferrum sp.]
MTVLTTAAMKIGDLVLYLGRLHYLRGLDPMSVPNRRAVLEDAETGEEVTAPITELEAPPASGDQRPAGV